MRTMRSGTSCFNGTLYRKTMARFWPLWALYGLFWMFAIPLNLMNRYFNYLRWTGGTGTPQDLLLDLAQSIPEYLAPGVWLAALMGLLCAMAWFGYLYNTRSACMMHALPMRRQWRKQRTEAGAAVAECEGLLPPKHDAGTATRHYRAFWLGRCRAAAAGAVLKPQGGNCAVLP